MPMVMVRDGYDDVTCIHHDVDADAPRVYLHLPWAMVGNLLPAGLVGDAELEDAIIRDGGPRWVRGARKWTDGYGVMIAGPLRTKPERGREV